MITLPRYAFSVSSAAAIFFAVPFFAACTAAFAENGSPFQINGQFGRAMGGIYNGITVVAGPTGVSITFSVIFENERAVSFTPTANFQEQCFFPRSALTPARLGGAQYAHGVVGVFVGGVANCSRTPAVGFWSGHEDTIETPSLQVAEALVRYINCAVGFTCKGRAAAASAHPGSTASRRTPSPAKMTDVRAWVEDGPSLPAPYNAGVFFIRLANLGQTTVRFDYGTVYDCVNIANCQMSGTGFIVSPGSTITIATLMSPEVCTDPLNGDGTPASNACAMLQSQTPSFQYTYHYTVIK